MKAFIRLTPAIILFVFVTLPAAAQTIDTAILGTITDSSGAVVPGATVTVLSSATGVSKVTPRRIWLCSICTSSTRN